jgi:hypothetical protein
MEQLLGVGWVDDEFAGEVVAGQLPDPAAVRFVLRINDAAEGAVREHEEVIAVGVLAGLSAGRALGGGPGGEPANLG